MVKIVKKQKPDAVIIVEAIILIIVFVCVIFTIAKGGDDLSSDAYRTYECDYKSASVTQTKIETEINGGKVTIKGDLFKLIEDPLRMVDENENVIAYAGDVYGFISQDDHGIYIGDDFVVNMCGKFDLLGETYELKDANGNVIGTVECNSTETNGSVKDINGNVIATYESDFMMNNFIVKICDNDICSDEAMLMIIASYVSDIMFD